MVLKSTQYDDVYFSAQDGLAETRHVFLDGNDLPAGWAGRKEFKIAETGFGTGLNFLAVWKLFEETRQDEQTLTFTSFEKFPLDTETIQGALTPWHDDIGAQLDVFLKNYKPETGRIQMTDHVALDLYIGDVNELLPKQPAEIDAWFLDGFRPSSNPDMWNEHVLTQVARMTKTGGSFATFTAAGFVRRALVAAGFEVKKIPGFGRKREMSIGRKS